MGMGTSYIQDFASLKFPSSVTKCKYLIVGKMGVGKSATGNTLLGMNLFETSVHSNSINSKTNICQRGKRERSKNFEIEVMDTPGLMDPRNPPNWAESIIARSLRHFHYKPNAILYVIKASDRIVEIDEEVLTCITKLFGPDCFKYMIVVFSYEDQLDGRSLAECLLEAARVGKNTALFKLLQHVGDRYLTITNKGTSFQEKNKQVLELLKMTQRMMISNNPQSYTCTFPALDDASTDQRFVRDIPIPPPPPPGNYCSLF